MFWLRATWVSHFVCSISLACLSVTLIACETQPTSRASKDNTEAPFTLGTGVTTIATDQQPQIVTGQVLYIPIYQEITGYKRPYPLTITLSIRNTDLTNPIILETVDYYDTGGTKLQAYLSQPVQLDPLASTAIVVKRDDQDGGSGANFIVAWGATTQVSTPIVEAVMVSTQSQQGLSFISPGRVIEER